MRRWTAGAMVVAGMLTTWSIGTSTLAYPGGLKLPRILADVSALVAGGYRAIFLKR